MKYIVKEINFKHNTPIDVGGKIIYVEKIMGLQTDYADYWALCMIEIDEMIEVGSKENE